MSKTLSEAARQNNSARVSKFASSIIPSAPEQDNPPPDVTPAPVAVMPVESPADAVQSADADFTEGRGVTESVDEPRTALPANPAPKPVRKRTGSLSMEDITGTKAPEDEVFGKMTRIAEKHHELLREIGFKHRKPISTILYNLLEVLDQTYQRDQQNHV